MTDLTDRSGGIDRSKEDGDPRTPVDPFVAYYGTPATDDANKTLSRSASGNA